MNQSYKMATEQQTVGDVIEITAMRYSIDWSYDTKHKINLKAIWGFELHWRGDDWHVIVMTKEKDSNLKNVTYELDHWVPMIEIRKLMNNPKVMIKSIVNFHSSKNFVSELQKILLK